MATIVGLSALIFIMVIALINPAVAYTILGSVTLIVVSVSIAAFWSVRKGITLQLWALLSYAKLKWVSKKSEEEIDESVQKEVEEVEKLMRYFKQKYEKGEKE